MFRPFGPGKVGRSCCRYERCTTWMPGAQPRILMGATLILPLRAGPSAVWYAMVVAACRWAGPSAFRVLFVPCSWGFAPCWYRSHLWCVPYGQNWRHARIEGQRPGIIPAWAEGPGKRGHNLHRAQSPAHGLEETRDDPEPDLHARPVISAVVPTHSCGFVPFRGYDLAPPASCGNATQTTP